MQAIKRWVKKNFSVLLYRNMKTAARKKEAEKWLSHLKAESPAKLADASYDIFTYHGEDGILLYLLSQLNEVPTVFVDIGAGDCIKSNCANLAVHYDWQGLFIDAQEKQLAVGKRFYKWKNKHSPVLKFCTEAITRENVNEVITRSAIGTNVGLLSIDIDGNDYWMWEAIEVIRPAIVVIEAKVEFGSRSIAVPYGKNNHHAADKMYSGASVEALRKLGIKKGYKMVGANKYGYNLFFVKNEAEIAPVTTAEILNDPEIAGSFYPEDFFNQHTFENI